MSFMYFSSKVSLCAKWADTLESIELQENLTYKEQPIKILKVVEYLTKSKIIRFCMFSGVTTQRAKLPGSMKKFWEPSSLAFSLASLNLKGTVQNTDSFKREVCNILVF